jgi:hypothetical protein
MFIVNLFSATVGFLHQIAAVGATRNITCSIDILAAGHGAPRR